jgi:hypothetical protein
MKTSVSGSKKNYQQFSALLIILNEQGMALNFAFTKGESLREATDMLQSVKRQCPELELVVTDKFVCDYDYHSEQSYIYICCNSCQCFSLIGNIHKIFV